MAIRQTDLSWSNYKKAAKTIKTINPGTTPQQIIGQLGYPVKNGQRIYITSDGQGGIKQRNRTAHQAREAVRQKRLRIQTGKLTPEEAAETRLKKDIIRASGNEADHYNESWLIGEQLERLKAEGGDVDAALARLKKAGYKLGNHPENIQSLSPEANKEKYQQNRALQDYLSSREALGQSPSAHRPDLIMTGADVPPLGGYVSPGLGPGDPFKIFTTAHRPEPVETGTPGTALTLPSLPNTTGPQMTDFKPQTVFNWENKPVSKKEPEPDLTLQLDPNKAASASFTGQGLPYFLEAVRDVGKFSKTLKTALDVVSGF